MSAAALASAGPAPIAPGSLRPAAIAAVLLVHALALFGLDWPNDPQGAALPPIEVQVVPQGEPAREAAPLGAATANEAASNPSEAQSLSPSEVQPVAEPPAVQPSAEPPQTLADLSPPERNSETARERPAAAPSEIAPILPEAVRSGSAPALVAELPTQEAAQAEVLPTPEPTPAAPTEMRPQPRARPEPTEAEQQERRRANEAAARRATARREREAERRREAANEERREAAREQAAKRAEQAEPSRRAVASQAGGRAGSASGGGGARGPSVGAISSAAYGALVAAELNRHKRYPEAARAAGAQGVVVVSFVVGPSGRVTSHIISRSSGNAVLDGAVRQMMAAIQLPPPPNGSFRASAPVRFNLAQ